MNARETLLTTLLGLLAVVLRALYTPPVGLSRENIISAVALALDGIEQEARP